MSAGLRDFVKAISPKWLSDGVAEKYLYLQGLDSDACLEKMNQGMQLHMPTYGDPSALPAIGADRVIPQGLNEPALGYATRLKFWLDDWAIAGDARSVLQQEIGELAPTAPMIRTVSDTSVWDTYIEGANPQATYPSHYKASPANWNWDNEADPHVSATAWWRWWLIAYNGMAPVGGGITAATNASPIQITTASAHGLLTGAKVWIDGVGGNLAANGTLLPGATPATAGWTITKVDNTNFTLNGSIGSGAYTSGGIVYSADGNSWCTLGPVFGQPGVVIGPASGGQTSGPWVTIQQGAYFSLPQTLPSPLAIGFQIPNPISGPPVASGLTAGIRAIVSSWKGAHTWCRWIIISFDMGEFNPFVAAGGVNPDGTWGPWAKVVSGQYVPSRYGGARYADGIA